MTTFNFPLARHRAERLVEDLEALERRRLVDVEGGLIRMTGE